MHLNRFRESASAAIRVLRHAHPPVAWVCLLGGGFVVAAALGALPPIYTGRIIDALQHLDAGGAFRDLAVYALLTVGAGLVQLASSYASTGFREAVVRNLRLALMRKIHRAHFDGLSAVTLGEIANRVMGDTESLCNQLEYAVLPTIAGLATIGAVITVMFYQNALLSAASVVLVATTAIPLRLVTPHLARMQKRLSSMRDDLCGIVNEAAALSALAILRNARANARQGERLGALTADMRSIRLKQSLFAGMAGLATTLLNVTGPAVILGIGTLLLVQHRIPSAGIIVAFLMFHSRLSSPVSSLSALPMQIASIGVIARRLLDVFDLAEEEGGNAEFEPGELRYCNVHVVRGERAILRDVTLTIPRGAHAAFVGPSGSGKSTLATLALRLSDPSTGSISVARRPLQDLTLSSLRDRVAIASQDPLIFDASALENLTCTNPAANMEAVQEALAICRLQDVISRLPAGLHERLGQRGFRLSGGERQRICLARALVQNPDILILDEALTGVDLETERAIIEDLRAVRAGRTMLVITHRLPGIASFSPIVVLEDGKVAACGSHDDLCSQSAWYRFLSSAPLVQPAVSA